MLFYAPLKRYGCGICKVPNLPIPIYFRWTIGLCKLDTGLVDPRRGFKDAPLSGKENGVGRVNDKNMHPMTRFARSQESCKLIVAQEYWHGFVFILSLL